MAGWSVDGELNNRCDVLHLLTRMNIGGPALHVIALTKRMRETHSILVASGASAAGEGEVTDPLVPVERVPLTRHINPAGEMRSFLKVRRLLTTRNPRILHTHMAKAGTLGRLASASLRASPKTVHTFHGHVLHGYFSKAATRVFIESERRLARYTDALVAVSNAVRDELVELGIGTYEQFRVIPVAVDLRRFLVQRSPGALRKRLGLSPQVALIGVAGRLVPIKDHITLFDAIKRIPDAHLVVLGDGEYRAALEETVDTMNLTTRVHFTGWWKDMAGAFADVDIVALTSINEGTPVALIEALAAGRPVVATDVGGVSEVVLHGTNGLLAPVGDSSEIARAIDSILSNPELGTSMARNGRTMVTARFDLGEVCRMTSDLYATLVE